MFELHEDPEEGHQNQNCLRVSTHQFWPSGFCRPGSTFCWVSGPQEVHRVGAGSVPDFTEPQASGGRRLTSAAVAPQLLAWALCEKKGALCGLLRGGGGSVWRAAEGEAEFWQNGSGSGPAGPPVLRGGRRTSGDCEGLSVTRPHSSSFSSSQPKLV